MTAGRRGRSVAAFVVVAALLFKIALVLSGSVGNEPPAPLWGRLPTTLLGDAVVAGLLWAFAARLARRWSDVVVVVVALLQAVVAVGHVFAVTGYGTPLRWGLWLAATGATSDMANIAAVFDVAVATVVLVVAAIVLVRWPPPGRALGATLLTLVLAGGIARVVDDPHLRRRHHLDEATLLALFPGGLAGVVHGADIGADVGANVDAVLEHLREGAAAPRGAGISPRRDHGIRHVVLFISESTALAAVNAETMPHLSSLADDVGVRFEQHVAESPLSIKALFALLCGLHPLPRTALETHAIPRIDCAFLPDVLKDRRAVVDAGLFHGGYFAFTDKLALLGERGFDALVDGEILRATSPEVWRNGWGVDDRVVVDEALRWLDSRPDPTAPSLNVVVPLVPHYEYFLPDGAETPFGTRRLGDRYRNGLRFADEVFDRLVDGYRKRGLYDDTVFIFVGDHGEAFEEHPHNRLHGTFLYEENIRTPLVILAPALFPAEAAPPGGRRSDRPTSHVDVLPTILDIVGQPVDDALDKRLDGQSVFSTSPPAVVPLSTTVGEGKVGLRTPQTKIIVDADGRGTVFDLQRDPHERAGRTDGDDVEALAAAAKAVAQRQEARLRQWPTRPEGADPYLQRVARASGRPARLERVFNMERWCLPVMLSSSSETVVLQASPLPRAVGVGVTDRSRFARRGGVRVTMTATRDGVDGASASRAFSVGDDFLGSSQVVPVALPGTSGTITITMSTLTTNGNAAPEVCLWLVP